MTIRVILQLHMVGEREERYSGLLGVSACKDGRSRVDRTRVSISECFHHTFFYEVRQYDRQQNNSDAETRNE
jgi:hypothetical protein